MFYINPIMEYGQRYNRVGAGFLVVAGICLELSGCAVAQSDTYNDDRGLDQATISLEAMVDQQNVRHGLVTVHTTEPVTPAAALEAAELAAFHNPQMVGLSSGIAFNCQLLPQERPLDYTADCTEVA